MSYQQVIAKKVKLNGLMGMQHHLIDRDRVKTNPDIDLSRSRFNYFIENLTAENLNSRVKSRIKQLNLKKRPRSDAVGLEDIVIKASPDFMLNADAQTRENYFSDALHFLQKRYGKENVMYCQCHMDESSPHIHVGIVPITSDGRLSAKSLFCPKTLEKLQTDFHREVAQHYGLERGESHAKKYLPIQKFKAKQAKIKAAIFTDDLHTSAINRQKIEEISKSVHYATTGVIFTSEDKENVQLPTKNFLALRKIAEEGVKAVAAINVLNDDIQKLKHDESQARSDLRYFLHELDKLEKSTINYTAVPKFWRKHIDSSIDNWQKTFIAYCHDVNRATVKVFISTHGNFDKTVQIMSNLIQNIGIKDIEKHITDVIRSAKQQFKNHSQPQRIPPSWKTPKPNDTDYKQPDESGIVPLQLSNVPDVNWDMINWDLLSELDKDEILHKKILREL